MMFRKFGCALILSVLLGACKSDRDAAHQFAADLASKECAQWLRCDGYGDVGDRAERATFSQSECERYSGDEFDRYTEHLLDEGRVRFDADAARECLDSFDDLCVGGQVTACDRALVGTIAVGGACTSSSECETGVCGFTSGNCGTCRATVPVGSACGIGTYCEPGSYCSASICTSYSDGTAVQVGLGESCGYASSYERDCAPGLYCDATDRCATRIATGLQCESGYDGCEVDSVCLTDANDVSRCVAVTTATSPGASCGPNAAGTSWVECDYLAGLYCDSDFCKALAGDGIVGADCRDNFDCDSGICDGDGWPGVCLASELANGSACRFDEQCDSFNCDVNSVCAAPACF